MEYEMPTDRTGARRREKHYQYGGEEEWLRFAQTPVNLDGRDLELHDHYAKNSLAVGHSPLCEKVVAGRNWPTMVGRPDCTCGLIEMVYDPGSPSTREPGSLTPPSKDPPYMEHDPMDLAEMAVATDLRSAVLQFLAIHEDADHGGSLCRAERVNLVAWLLHCVLPNDEPRTLCSEVADSLRLYKTGHDRTHGAGLN